MKVRDVMTLDIETVSPDDKARTAAQLMADLGCEVLPVREDNKLVGMITTGDLAVRLMANRCDPDAVSHVHRVALLLREREHRGCVGEDERLVGAAPAGGEPR